jgi:hypothetical protein
MAYLRFVLRRMTDYRKFPEYVKDFFEYFAVEKLKILPHIYRTQNLVYNQLPEESEFEIILGQFFYPSSYNPGNSG